MSDAEFWQGVGDSVRDISTRAVTHTKEGVKNISTLLGDDRSASRYHMQRNQAIFYSLIARYSPITVTKEENASHTHMCTDTRIVKK